MRGHVPVQRPLGVGAHDHQPDIRPSQPRRDLRVVQRPVGSREIGEIAQLARESDLLTQRRHPALELQQPHRHLPAVARVTDDEIGIGFRVVEEHLVEF